VSWGAAFGHGSSAGQIEYVGQSFVAQGDYLDSLTFYIGNQTTSQVLDYRVLVTSVNVAADGFRPGDVLFESATQRAPVAVTGAYGNAVAVTIDTGHLKLTEGQTYAFIVDSQSVGAGGSDFVIELSYAYAPHDVNQGINYAGGYAFSNDALTSTETRTQAFSRNWVDYDGRNEFGFTFDADLRFKLEFHSNVAPTDISLSASGIAENSPNGTVVGDLSATDADPGDTFTFALTDDASGRFAISGNHLVVADGSHLDYEAATSHQVEVQVTDSKGHTYLESFAIQLSDVFEFTTITGTRKSEKIDANHAPNGQPKPGADADFIDARKGNDTVKGLGGDDTINGGKGKDVLDGGKGRDAFVFDAKLDSSNVDTIHNFKPGADQVWLDKDIYLKLKSDVGTTIGEAAFHASKSGKAHDKSDRIIYETDTGNLSYDDNGTRAGHAILIAHLDKGLHLTEANFLIV
jgi:Ca2+-binding RTX toxin-like protein